ncbi:hypothetical protein D4R71_00400 [bacterium]|nr:MAG: hypothetical protein D4R71_00400 [bacterium]
MNALQPLWDYVILERPDSMIEKIIRPESADPKKVGTLELRVISTGPCCRNVRVGDQLIFNPAATVTFSYEGKQYWLISERATAAVVAEKRDIEENSAEGMPQ